MGNYDYSNLERSSLPHGKGPWPYNLMTEIATWQVPEPEFEQVDAAREEEIVDIIREALSERRAFCLLAYYRNNATLKSIASEARAGINSVRSDISRGMWVLRHPRGSFMWAILLGRKTAENKVEAFRSQKELEKRCRELASELKQTEYKLQLLKAFVAEP